MKCPKKIHIAAALILIDSVAKLCKNYYLQIFLEDCKYLLKENEMTKFIYQKLEWDFFYEAYSSDDSNKDVDWGINDKADKKRFF